MRVALRMLGGHLMPGDPEDEKPFTVEWISADLPVDYDPIPDKMKMRWWDEHILPALNNAKYARNKAALAVDWDAGPRSGEFRSLTVGDVGDHKHGKEITVDGRQGQRSVTLITSVPYLKRWLEVHPKGDDPEAPLWCDLDTGREVSYKMKQKMIRKPVERAVENGDLKKPSKMGFTRMRKSSASYLARKNVSQNQLERHHGWVENSDEARRYIIVFSIPLGKSLVHMESMSRKTRSLRLARLSVRGANAKPRATKSSVCGVDRRSAPKVSRKLKNVGSGYSNPHSKQRMI